MAQYAFPPRGLTDAAAKAMGEKPTVPRSRFTSTFNKLTTFDAGQLIPFLVDEILPGDHMRYDITAFLRMATPLFPIFSSQRIDTHVFFVPNRLLWVNWRQFMGQQDTPGASTAFTIPTLALGNFLAYSVYDYFGLPMGTNQHPVSALPLRAYRLIYQEWFRDENITTGVPVTGGNGPDALSSYVVWQRAKSHDYFTSALPWPQKITAPIVPIAGQAPVTGIGIGNAMTFPTAGVNVQETDIGPTTYPFARATSDAGQLYVRGTGGGAPEEPLVFANMQGTGVGVTVEALRQAFAIQALLERDARGGTRYIEMVKAQFGVTSPDSRQQRPEYIGGGSTPLNVTPIAQTATGGGGLGALGAAANAVGSHRASYAATEHGYIIGIISVKTELAYQQALHKMWTRSTRYDFYFPALANLGEQAILKREIMSANTPADFTVFGYQERWHEYRTRYSEVTGAFRSGIAGTLDTWHLAQFFVAPLDLTTSFIEDRPPMSRVLAAGVAANNQQYFADIQIRRDATRPLPTYSTPVHLGRF